MALTKRYKEGLEIVDAIINEQHEPSTKAEAISIKGLIYNDMGQIQAGRELQKQASELNPFNISILGRRAGSELLHGNKMLGLAIAKGAFNINEHSSLAIMAYGTAEAMCGNSNEGLRMAEKLIRKYPQDPKGYLLRRGIYDELGKALETEIAELQRKIRTPLDFTIQESGRSVPWVTYVLEFLNSLFRTK